MENSNKSGNNFLSGFLLGALIGVAIALLLVTKKGKKILKAISEEGGGKISNILEKIENSVDVDKITGEEASSSASEKEENLPQKKFIAKKTIEERPASPRGEPKVRRFFKGISRHAN